MIEFIDNIDSTIFLFFNGLRAPFFDRLMMMFTDTHIWIPLYAVLVLMILKGAGWRAGLLFLVAAVIAITLTDQTCATIIRPMAVRLRPSNLENPLSEFAQIVDNYRGGPFGFPSCHAANSFALALFVTLFYQRRAMTWMMLLWAVFNSYTRLYLGVHYPGDLIVGGLIGSCFGICCYMIARGLVLRFPNTFSIGHAPMHTIQELNENINTRVGAPIFQLKLCGSHKEAVSCATILWVVFAVTLFGMLVMSL